MRCSAGQAGIAMADQFLCRQGHCSPQLVVCTVITFPCSRLSFLVDTRLPLGLFIGIMEPIPSPVQNPSSSLYPRAAEPMRRSFVAVTGDRRVAWGEREADLRVRLAV